MCFYKHIALTGLKRAQPRSKGLYAGTLPKTLHTRSRDLTFLVRCVIVYIHYELGGTLEKPNS